MSPFSVTSPPRSPSLLNPSPRDSAQDVFLGKLNRREALLPFSAPTSLFLSLHLCPLLVISLFLSPSISQKLLSFTFFTDYLKNKYLQDFFQCLKALLVPIVITAQNFPTGGPLRGGLSPVSLLVARHAHISGRKVKKIALMLRLIWEALVSLIILP